jgi:hypothetical protein
LLVALVALAPVYGVNPQDTTRTCLAKAIAHGRVHDDACFYTNNDFAVRNGHYYSDKAPGLAIVEIPAVAALRLPDRLSPGWRLWSLRLLVIGSSFLVCAFLVGRVTEGLVPGFGAVTPVTFGLGTLAALFAATGFDGVPAALLGFAAFLLAWRRRPFLAGLAGGAGILVEYQVGAIVAVLAVYVGLTGLRQLGRYAAGVVPGVALLALYDQVAFGAPWHLSYDYIGDLNFRHAQAAGMLGVAKPTAYGLFQTFAGTGGLLVTSPVLLAAACGLVAFSRAHRREAAVCGVVALVFLAAEAGYFLPYGGSPGPRFVVPALPFLALGLGYAFARFPRAVTALAVISVVSTTMLMLHWSQSPSRSMWAELARVPAHPRSARFVRDLERTAWDWVLPGRAAGAIAVGVCALSAIAVAVRSLPWAQLREERARRRRRPVPLRTAVLVGAVVMLAATANVLSAGAYPYQTVVHDLTVSVSGSRNLAYQGQEVDFDFVIGNKSEWLGYGPVVLTVALPSGMKLLGPPFHEHGSGCHGARTIRCDLGGLRPDETTPVRLAVRMMSPYAQTLSAQVWAPPNFRAAHPATFFVAVR